MAQERTMSELWFERYLDQGGWTYEFEPDLGIIKDPDYLVAADGLDIVCEVKEFTTSGFAKRVSQAGGRAFTMNPVHISKTPARRVRDAAEQLEELEGRGMALVAVLANPHGIAHGNDLADMTVGADRFPFLSAVGVLSLRARSQDYLDDWRALNGPRIRAQYSKTRDQAFAFLEAIDQLDMPEGDYMRMDLVHTVSAQAGTAVAVPRHAFRGPEDLHWGRDDRGGLVELHAGEAQ